MEYSTAFENSSTPFRFYQTNIVLEPDRSYFPYTNWFRGEYTSCFPIIADREAGFYPRTEPLTTGCDVFTDNEEKITHCFRGSTQQMRKCYTTDNTFNNVSLGSNTDGVAAFGGAKWVQTDPSYLGNRPILSYI